MQKLVCLSALLLILALAGCAGVLEGQGTASHPPFQYGNSNWGSDAICSPGCAVGMSRSW